jgi:hypothetical protein
MRRIEAMNLDVVAHAAFEDSAIALADAGRSQLEHGLNRFAEILQPYKSPWYANIKHAKNPLPGLGVPDLKLTGAFHRGIYADVQGDRIVWGSRDEKSERLQKKYDAIFGLNRDSKSAFIREHLRPAFNRQIEQATGLKFK